MDDGTFLTHRLEFIPTSAHRNGSFTCEVVCLNSGNLPTLTSQNCSGVLVGKFVTRLTVLTLQGHDSLCSSVCPPLPALFCDAVFHSSRKFSVIFARWVTPVRIPAFFPGIFQMLSMKKCHRSSYLQCPLSAAFNVFFYASVVIGSGSVVSSTCRN